MSATNVRSITFRTDAVLLENAAHAIEANQPHLAELLAEVARVLHTIGRPLLSETEMFRWSGLVGRAVRMAREHLATPDRSPAVVTPAPTVGDHTTREAGMRLPTFNYMLDNASSHLSEARDWLASDWAPGHGPTDDQVHAYRTAQRLIGQAKDAIEASKVGRSR